MHEATDPVATDETPALADPTPPLSLPSAPPPAVPVEVPRRHDRLALALLALIATAFFFDVLAGFDNFYMRDLTRYYYPTKQILREIVRGGEMPLWNRYFSGGQPIAANPEHEVFYPLTWLILLPSYDLGYRLHILVHIYIGLLAMYALLRSMELRPPAAFFGALAWGLGGIYLSYINLLPILFCAAWLPLTCLYVRRFLLKPSVRDFSLGALFLGLQFLVGEPTTVMQTGLLLGMYALYRGWYSRPRLPKMAAAVALVGAVSLAAVAVGAAQMIPALDHVGDSARSRPFDFSLVSAWSMPWAKLGEILYPNLLGHIAIHRVMWYWGGGLYPGMGSPFVFNIYCGLLMIALAVGGAFVRPRGGRFVLLVVALSLLLALGSHTPLLKLLYDHHIATSIRYPEKFVLMGVFAMLLFASQMLERLLAGDDTLRDTVLGFVLATTFVALALAAAAFTPQYAQMFMRAWGYKPGAGTTHMLHLVREGWIYAAARGVALGALLWWIRTLRRPVWLALLAIFVCLDLLPVVDELNPRMPQRFFTERPELDRKLPPNRADFRVFHEADWYGTEETAKSYFSTGDAVYWVVRNGLFPMTPAGWGIRTVLERDYDKTALLPTIDLIDSVWDVKRSGRTDWWRPFVTMSNAWYRANYRPFEAEKKRVKGQFKRAQPVQFEEVAHSPRYYFADQLITVKDRHDFVNRLVRNSYTDTAAFVYGPSFVPARGTVLRSSESANRAAIDVESFGRGFLVMSVTPHKYWRIAVDGTRVQPVITNIGYQGIVVPPGRHRVTMEYRNELVERGAMISAASVIVLAALALVRRRRPAEA